VMVKHRCTGCIRTNCCMSLPSPNILEAVVGGLR
jgi:hypothetical protein